MATDTGKLRKRKNIIKPIICKRCASRRVPRRSTFSFRSIPNFLHTSVNMIEMKTFVSKGTILQNKISPVDWQNQNIFDTHRRTTTQADTLLKIPETTKITELTRSLEKTSDERLSRFWDCPLFLLKLDRLHLTAATDGDCKNNSKHQFRGVNLYKEFAYKSKIEQMGTTTTIELTTRSTKRNPTMCEVTWKHLENMWMQLTPMHKSSNIENTSFCVGSFCCQLVSLSFDCLPCSIHAHCLAQAHLSLSLRSSHRHLHVSCARRMISSTSPFTSSIFSSSLVSSCCTCCLTPSTSLKSWITSPRTSIEDLGPLAEKKSSTGFEPNDHMITEAYVVYTQESLTEQRFPENFDNDDITIGQTLLNAYRRQVDHSEGEGLSSSSSMNHGGTVQPVVNRGKSHESSYEIQRENSENEQIRALLDRNRCRWQWTGD